MPPTKRVVSPATAYERALEDARKRAFTIRDTGYRKIINAFSDSLTRLSLLETSSNALTAARASSLKAQIHGLLRELNATSASAVSGSVNLTVQELVRIHERVNRQILAQHAPGLAIRVAFDHIPARVLGVIAARNGNAAHFRSLLNHRFSATIDQVDQLIDSAVLRGVSGGDLTRDLAMMMSDHSLVGSIPSGSRLHRGELGNIDWSRYGIDPLMIPQARKILYDARRIAVSEPMNAMREANAHSLTASPLTSAAKWQTNSRHELIDECDIFARGTFYEGLPGGFFPVDMWPRAPHPHCGCYPGKVLMRPAKEWGSPKTKKFKRRSEPYLEPSLRERVRPKTMENAVASSTVNQIRIPTAGPPGSPVAPKPKPAPKPKGPPRPMTKTDAQIDAAIRGVLAKPSSAVHTPQALADQVGEAMDAAALGWNTRTQKAIRGPKIILGDPEVNNRALGTAFWDGHIGLDNSISDGLAKFRAHHYITGTAAQSREAMSAMKTLIHELEHMRSPKRMTGRYTDAISYGNSTASRYLEEGIVERKARNRMARLFFDKEHWSGIPEGAMQRSYPEYTNGVEWFAQTFGEAALEEVWQGTNSAIRIKTAGTKIRAHLTMEARKFESEEYREKMLDLLKNSDDEKLVNAMHRFKPTTKQGWAWERGYFLMARNAINDIGSTF
jgi:hypothetical protein